MADTARKQTLKSAGLSINMAGKVTTEGNSIVVSSGSTKTVVGSPTSERDDRSWKAYVSQIDSPISSSLLVNGEDLNMASNLGFLYDYYEVTEESNQAPPSPPNQGSGGTAGQGSSSSGNGHSQSGNSDSDSGSPAQSEQATLSFLQAVQQIKSPKHSTSLIQGDHGNHHVNLKQEKVTSSVKALAIGQQIKVQPSSSSCSHTPIPIGRPSSYPPSSKGTPQVSDVSPLSLSSTPPEAVEELSGKDWNGQELYAARAQKRAERQMDLKSHFEKRTTEGINSQGAVPSEILARGTLAFEAYSKALAEGRACDKRVPIMLIGQDRSGKTSLKNSFMGKPFNSDEDSTVGIDVDPSHFKVSTEVWKVGEKNQETNSGTSISYEHQAALLTVQNMIKEESMSKDGDPDDSNSVTASPAPVVANIATHEDHKLSDVTNDFRSDETSHFEISSDANSSCDSITGMPDDIASLIEVLLREGDEVDDKGDLYSVLWDFGGQAVYYATHPLFLTPRAIYLLVNDLSRDPRGRAKSVMKQGMFTKFEDSFDFRSNFDYLEFWMSSVASLAIEDESDHQAPRSTLLPEKLPPVFLVCTHADIPYGGVDSTTLANEVFGSLQTKPYETHLYHHVFVVDNTKSGNESECPEVQRLRKEILDVAKELPQMKEAIPIKWLRYEKELQVMKEDGHKCIPLEHAKQVASEVCNIVDDEQFLTLLNFLHDQRILIHFADTPELNRLVVLDPQWLIDVFKEVITIRPYQGKEKEFKKLWFKLEKEGILEEKLLDHVWGPLFDSKETSESLMAIMEKFSLLCPLPSCDESCSKQYLVPSMLMSHPPEDIAELIKSAHIPSLFLKFESCHFLRGLFPRLVLQFFQWAKDQSMIPVKPQLYHNFASFYISEDENCSVVLLCHSFSIEVVVHKDNSSHGQLAAIPQSKLPLSSDANCDSCARAVRRQLGLILESMRKEFCWLKNLKYEVSFICPVCCQGSSVNYCRTHHAKRCEQEECLHFWSESQLCNVKTLSCSESAVAQNKRFQTKQFAPWLLPQRNQLIAAKHDRRNLDEAKEIALPDEVQKSLLSQSCDAKEVVLQLQVKQASLEQPDRETKALIRCLARKSKDSGRHDVFQHLREIMPAGTTGPLLPEHLDVRNIPGSKGREVTINLCGGEEWKVVAEALGLTPPEIRFLDNRTLNPFDAALAFIAKQRCITVGYLYDVLNECGCPVIADLL